ncbi:radical SAM protein [Candidatus Woesearchaeota archaeon]|nr:radical SAM protein [Candidatus Woesearchaeota archaeon]
MHVTLINPNICMQRGDFFGTGIPYLPMSLAWVAGYLRQKHSVTVIDAFGEKPMQMRTEGKLHVQGLTVPEILARVPQDTDIIFVYAAKVVAFTVTKAIVAALRKQFEIPIVMLENTQSVVAYSLKTAGKEFLDAGADYCIIGEAENRVDKLLAAIAAKKDPDFDGILYRKNGKDVLIDKKEFIQNLDELPFPAWDLFPLKNYWALGYAHGPMQGKYVPLLTSRGCPYGCKYCVVPATNARRWRFRSPKHVVDEIEHWVKTLGVTEFHLEDLNPTVRKDRIVEICREILARDLKISWKIVAGTKVETMDRDTVTWMAKAGCTYVSISPESGSPAVLKLMDKPFNHELALDMVRHMHKLGITTQACFVLGFPGETPEDLQLTRKYVNKLVKAGIDEVALFVMTPIPGSNQFNALDGYENYSQLTFTPIWRKDFKRLSSFRNRLYAEFYLRKLLFHPVRLIRQPFNVLFKNFETKTEMTAFRTLKLMRIIATS